MPCRFCGVFLLALSWLGPGHAVSAEQTAFASLSERSRVLIAAMDTEALSDADDDGQVLPGPNLRIRQCDGYPYSEPASAPGGRGGHLMIADMRQGLKTGLECLTGSDYIRDPERNRRHQQTACAILKDDALWSNAHKPYRQKRLWHPKGYDSLKAEMRADYDS